MFLSVDPVKVDTTSGWNFCRYCYAANSPYKFTDPDGRVINFAVGFAIGAGIDAIHSYATTGEVDVQSALVSGLAGSLTGGVGGALTKMAAVRAISTRVATAGTVTTGAATGAATANIHAMDAGGGPSVRSMVVGATIGAVTSGAGASLTNGGQAMALSRMAAAPVNSPAGIGIHVAQATAPVVANAVKAQSTAASVTSISAEAAGKVVEKALEKKR